MKKELVITIILVVLLVVSGIQAFQLSDIKDKIRSGSASGLVSARTGSTPATGSAPSNPQYGMVGGC